jgi:broad specificity phosphatase PhoE
MPAIYLIRHGQASFDAEDYDQLSDLGMRQSTHLGEIFAAQGLAPNSVICGGMLRHRQTADKCLAGLNVSVDELPWRDDSDWNEYDHTALLQAYTNQPGKADELVADMSGDNPRGGFQRHFAEAMSRWVDGIHDADYPETWTAFCDRVERALATAVQGNKGNVFVFTSGGAVSAVCRKLLGLSNANAAQLSWQLANAAYSKVIAGSAGLNLASLNEHSHFDGRYRELLSHR